MDLSEDARPPMPLPQIAIEIAAPASAMGSSPRSEGEGGVEARRILVTSCDRAAATAECAIAHPDTQAAILALVFWRGAGHVRVEVALAGRSTPWAIRELEFSSRDPALEKWRTIGYTVGSLASEALVAEEHADGGVGGAAGEAGGDAQEQRAGAAGQTATAEGNATHAAQTADATKAAPEPAAKPEAPPDEEQTARAQPKDEEPETRDRGSAPRAAAVDSASHRWSIAAGGLVGSGLASVRGGGFLRVRRAFDGPFATVALAYSADAGDGAGVSAERVALSAGGGYEIALGRRFALDLRGELVAENLAAHVEQPGSGRTDRQSRWVAAFDAGAELVSALAGPVAVVVGVDGTIRTNRTDVQVGRSVFATAPMADVLALFGVRAALR